MPDKLLKARHESTEDPRWKGRNILDARDFEREDVEQVCLVAAVMEELTKQHRAHYILQGFQFGSCFKQPSTRTRISFESAAEALGACVIHFHPDDAFSASVKGESWEDNLRVLRRYFHGFFFRAKEEGYAADNARIIGPGKPVFNAGDGWKHHPTQALLDARTTQKMLGRLDNLVYLEWGDLHFSRVVHSRVDILSNFRGVSFIFVAPDELPMPQEYLDMLERKKVPYRLCRDYRDVIGQANSFYATRLQWEHFKDSKPELYERLKREWVLSRAVFDKAIGNRTDFKLFHPGPTNEEVPEEFDDAPYNCILEQVEQGKYTRMALLALTAGKARVQDGEVILPRPPPHLEHNWGSLVFRLTGP